MADFVEEGKQPGGKGEGSLGSGALVFVGGMALAAASFLVERYVINSLRKL